MAMMRNEFGQPSGSRSYDARSPDVTLRPIDLINPDRMTEIGFGYLCDTGVRHNAMGMLLASCAQDAPVYVGWTVDYLCSQLIGLNVRPRFRLACIFGLGDAVRVSYSEIYRYIGRDVENARNRCLTLQNGRQIYFVYQGDDPRGYHFDSIWLVGDRRPPQRSMVLGVDVGSADESAITTVQSSGYRDVIRAQDLTWTQREDRLRELEAQRLELLLETQHNLAAPANNATANNATATATRANSEFGLSRLEEMQRLIETYHRSTRSAVESHSSVASDGETEKQQEQEEEESEVVKFPERRLFLTGGDE